jgi:Plasmid replication region DNA-binding N-term
MRSKSKRGVQQDDVWAAADALVEEGLRPTIERVRAKIGRGSPNTVSPMLEAWFYALGQRLGLRGIEAEVEGLPAPVQQAAVKLWKAVMLSAQQEAVCVLEQERKTLQEERAALEVRESELAHREQVLIERQVVTEEVLNTARSQITDLTTRLEEFNARKSEGGSLIGGSIEGC